MAHVVLYTLFSFIGKSEAVTSQNQPLPHQYTYSHATSPLGNSWSFGPWHEAYSDTTIQLHLRITNLMGFAPFFLSIACELNTRTPPSPSFSPLTTLSAFPSLPTRPTECMGGQRPRDSPAWIVCCRRGPLCFGCAPWACRRKVLWTVEFSLNNRLLTFI